MRSFLAAGAALLAFAPGAVAAPTFDDGFGVRPIKRHGSDVAPAYFQLEARPGDRRREAVVMWNSSKRPIELVVDGVDGLTGTTSGAVYANADDPHRETSRWIRPTSRHVTLQPGTQRRFDFRVRVPGDARPGEHLGGLAFQNARSSTSGARFAVRQVLRVVLGVQITIAGGRPPQVALGAVELDPLPGTQVPSAVVQLGNEGEKACRPRLRIALDGVGQRRRIDRPLDTILPGDRIAFPAPIPGRLPAGRYRARTTVGGCGAERRADEFVVLADALSGTTPQAAVAQPAPQVPASLPWWLLAGVLTVGLGAGLLGAGAWRRRWRPRSADLPRHPRPSPAPRTPGRQGS